MNLQKPAYSEEIEAWPLILRNQGKLRTVINQSHLLFTVLASSKNGPIFFGAYQTLVPTNFVGRNQPAKHYYLHRIYINIYIYICLLIAELLVVLIADEHLVVKYLLEFLGYWYNYLWALSHSWKFFLVIWYNDLFKPDNHLTTYREGFKCKYYTNTEIMKVVNLKKIFIVSNP